MILNKNIAMKINKILLGLIMLTLNVQAQIPANSKVIITGSRFTYPLVEKWISEFKKEHPEIEFRIIARGGSNTDSADLVINAHKLRPEEIKPGFYTVFIGRYALLPFTNSKNPMIDQWQKKGLKEKDLKKLYFLKYDPYASQESEKEKKKNQYAPVIYTRAQKACAPITFASNYGFEQDDILGKPIGGDDKHIITAVERDTNGISYNNLNLLYNTQTRKIKNNLAIIPLDLNDNGKLDTNESFYESLDEVIKKLENEHVSKIAVQYLNVLYSSQVIENNKNLSLFLDWVFLKGQQYNHELGFLNFEPEVLNKQKEIFDASKNKQ